MQMAIKEKIDKLTNLSGTLSRVGLLVAEEKTDVKSKIAQAKKS